MRPRVINFISLCALAAGLMGVSPALAQNTQCRPGDLFCAELRVGPARGGIRIGGGRAQPPPPVIVQPAPPPIVIQQAPPPPPPVIIQRMPQPPTVIVQQAPPPPPPRVVIRRAPPPPPRVIYQQVPQRQVVVVQDRYPSFSIGAHLQLSGMFGDVNMGGAGAALRLRPIPNLAIDLGSALYMGRGYQGEDRREIPLTADVLFFFNPRNRFQFYAVAGIGGSFAQTESRSGGREMTYFGGELGVGAEWRISRVFALNVDVRGFLRQRVDDNPTPEFTEVLRDGTTRSTDTSGGVLLQGGMTFYFGR